LTSRFQRLDEFIHVASKLRLAVAMLIYLITTSDITNLNFLNAILF
jgi:hypothetical protein